MVCIKITIKVYKKIEKNRELGKLLILREPSTN